MRILPLCCLASLLTLACGGAEQPLAAPGAPIDPPKPNQDLLAMLDEPGSEPTAEEKKKAADAQKLADDLKKLESDQAAEKLRMTDALRKELADLAAKKFPNVKAALTASLAGSHRTPGARDRDQERHPVAQLEFFNLRTNMSVLELDAGAGWYTEILAPVLKREGKLAVSAPSPRGLLTERATYYGRRLSGTLDKAPELGEKVEFIPTSGPALAFEATHASSFDLVLAFRTLHNWQRRDQMDHNLKEVFKVLKPGGLFGVEAHRAKAGADPKTAAEKGYLPEAYVIERATAAGFVLDKKSEINANPKDTADHPHGVWSLPPNLRGGDQDRDKYTAIGESDRMTLRFKKPLKAAN